MKKISLICILILSLPFVLVAGESSIPLQKGVRVASDDLVYEGRVLSTREADTLLQQNVDISALEPKKNDLWDDSTKSTIVDQEAIAIGNNDTLFYEGGLLSSSGLYRFNAIPENGNKIYTIHLDKTLHTMLLRKNLLRALGYKIPAMKYLKNVTIRFRSAAELDTFLKHEIPEATLGAPERWVTIGPNQGDKLSLILKDIAITEPSDDDFYNVSMGLPTQVINSRTLRSLIVPYSLVDLYESVNKFNWICGKIDNKAVVLDHFTANDFSTSLEDAIWMIKKINKLNREDFRKIVATAYFPKDIEALITEKLISRRNSLNRLFNLNISEIAFDSKITIGAVVNGKANLKDYPDYASRFSHGDAESPMDKLGYFLLSKVQANILDNLVAQFNSKLVAFDVQAARLDYYKKQFKDGLEHFIQTGELSPIGVGFWYSPDISAKFLFSRDIVVGNYLGSDNLVQLADTFGASADIGLFIGMEGLGNNLTPNAKISTSLVRSYTHLKPVKDLRQSMKEPYKNMFVSLIKSSLKEKFLSLSELENAGKIDNANEEQAKTIKEDQRKKIEEMISEISKKLDVGESLIITDRLIPTVSVHLNFSQGLIGAGVGVSGNVTVLKRIHLYKKSPTVLQIFDDSGFVRSIDLSFQVTNYITLLKVNAGQDKGHYKVNSYQINLSTDLNENPNLFKNSLAIYNVLKNRNFELLDKTSEPVEVSAQYKDNVIGGTFLFWKTKYVTGKTYFDITAKNGVKGSYFSLNKDLMQGITPESFSKQLANYYLTQVFKNVDIKIDEESGLNPGESFFGRSTTQSLRFEAAYNDQKQFTQKFLSLSDIKQGWAMSEKRLRKFMDKVNTKFGQILFDPTQLDFNKMRLYKIGYHLNIYNHGLERLLAIKKEDIKVIEDSYKKVRRCAFDDSRLNTAICGDLRFIVQKINKCPKIREQEELANCTAELFKQMMDDLEFADFKRLLGEDNIYVYGAIDGLRENSEILNDTIYSNSIGKISSKQWDGPLASVRDLLGLSDGEFSGKWLRESI